jgi:hypothetical protein
MLRVRRETWLLVAIAKSGFQDAHQRAFSE